MGSPAEFPQVHEQHKQLIELSVRSPARASARLDTHYSIETYREQEIPSTIGIKGPDYIPSIAPLYLLVPLQESGRVKKERKRMRKRVKACLRHMRLKYIYNISRGEILHTMGTHAISIKYSSYRNLLNYPRNKGNTIATQC